MYRFLLCLGLVAGIGAAAAWTMNHNRYGYREAKFGPFDTAGEVTVDNMTEHLHWRSAGDKQHGIVEMIDETDHDFGVMPPGTEGQHSFRFRNAGEGDLNLRLGASTCKCTLGELDKAILKPGEETEITLTWTVKANTRDFSQSAQLLTSDPISPAITMKIMGRVISDFEVVPETWIFNNVAAGEPFEISGEIYNFTDSPIQPGNLRFTSKAMTQLAEFDVQPIAKEDFSEDRKSALEAFRVTAKVAAGMRQDAISQNLVFAFTGYVAPSAKSPSAKSSDEAVEGSGDPAENQESVLYVPTQGRIVGSLTMMESNKLRKRKDGGYTYNFGRISRGGSLTAKTFIVLKGKERENTTLMIGKIAPAGVVEATLGKPKSRGSMVLYPLTFRLIPGDKPIERMGKSKDDYGRVWIESDNPKVTKMGVVLTFGIPPR